MGLSWLRYSNIAWLTDGMENRIVYTSKEGTVKLIVLKDKILVLTSNIETERIVEEEKLDEKDFQFVINQWFEKDLTKKILVGLEQAGIEWIEMGHGRGLGANKRSGKSASSTDEEYIDLAKESLKKSKFGFLCQKKFATTQDIKAADERGLDFIRIAANITEIDQIENFIKYSKEQGLIVFTALMKAYAVTDMKEYTNILKKLEKWGANIITLMDSAGTMLPEDVQKYINFVKVHSEVKLGFHAHNNLQLGIASVITAIKAGADEIDVSIGGLGRSSGNAPTEILAILIEKYGWRKKLDYKILPDLNDKYIFPLIKRENRFSSKALTFGFAGFHSGFYPIIENIIQNNPSIDYKDLIIAVSKIEKVKVNKIFVEEIANNLFNKNKRKLNKKSS